MEHTAALGQHSFTRLRRGFWPLWGRRVYCRRRGRPTSSLASRVETQPWAEPSTPKCCLADRRDGHAHPGTVSPLLSQQGTPELCTQPPPHTRAQQKTGAEKCLAAIRTAQLTPRANALHAHNYIGYSQRTSSPGRTSHVFSQPAP